MQAPAPAPLALQGRKATVIGAGVSGVAAANALAKRGAVVRLIDSRTIERPIALLPQAAFEANTNEVHPGDLVVLSPGIPAISPLHAEVAALASEVMGEVELFYRLCPAPILAVTGTDGKSTVTTMLGDIMTASGRPTFVGGNLGNPLCEELDYLTPEHVVVAEVSAFQLSTCSSFRPRVAILTNIAEDHTDYYGSFELYQAAKRLIWRGMTSEDTLILNAADPYIQSWDLSGVKANIQYFGLAGYPDSDAAFLGDELTLTAPDGLRHTFMTREELNLLGDHNVMNALAAAQAASLAGVDLNTIRQALMAYAPLAHRLAPVPTTDGLRWVDDSKATSPNATMAALKALSGELIVLVGGSSKDADFTALAGEMRLRAKHAICFGATREAIAQSLGDFPHTLAPKLADAVRLARSLAQPGDTVLLSPACASFDEFKGYAHRGEVFSQLVRKGA